MHHKFCVVSQINLIIIAGFVSCLLASSVLANNNDSSTVENPTQTTNTADDNNLPCLPDSALNALLVQMLMALQPYFLSNQYQQQRMPFPNNNNELFAPVTEMNQPIIRTTVVTSSVVSTLTQTLSKIISIWFRNERIPTTLYSQTTTLVTDFITITSTLNVEPTAEWKRDRREVNDDATFLESSLLDEDNFAAGYYRTQVLHDKDESVGVQGLPIHLMHPRVVEAWNNFLHVLEETQNDARKTK